MIICAPFPVGFQYTIDGLQAGKIQLMLKLNIPSIYAEN